VTATAAQRTTEDFWIVVGSSRLAHTIGRQTALMAATRRPAAEEAFFDPTTGAAWKTLPSWAIVATGDKAAGTALKTIPT